MSSFLGSDQILEIIKEVVPAGFQIIFFNSEPRIEKLESNRLLSISLGYLYNDIAEYKPYSYIAFLDVEDIYTPKFIKSRDIANNMTVNPEYVNSPLPSNKGKVKHLFQHFPLSLDTPENLALYKSILQEYIQVYSLPFFDYWADFRLLLPYIETDDGLYVHYVFAGGGFEKKFICWKLCNHPKLESFIEERTNIFENAIAEQPNDIGLKKDFEGFKKFLNRLSKVKPIYEWDDKYLELQKGNPVFPEK